MKRQEGQSLVEVMLVLPVVAWLILAVAFLVQMQHVKMVLTSAARAAGREAAQVWDWSASDVWRRESRKAVKSAGLDPERLEVKTERRGLYRGFLSYTIETPAPLRIVLPSEMTVMVKGADIP